MEQDITPINVGFFRNLRTQKFAEGNVPSCVGYMVCDSAPQNCPEVGTARATLGFPRAKFCPLYASAT